MAKKTTTQHEYESSYLSGNSAGYIQGLYQDYLKDPESVDASWRSFFSKLASEKELIARHHIVQERMRAHFKNPQAMPAQQVSAGGSIASLIDAYYCHGHYFATLDPLGLKKKPEDKAVLLDHSRFGFAKNDCSCITFFRDDTN